MSIDAVAAHVSAVLARAESLFTAPDPEVLGATATASAAQAGTAIATHSGEMSGSFAAAHHELLDATAQQLHHTADADAGLVEHLANAAETHGDGRRHAAQIRSGAEDISTKLAPWAELEVSDLAVLTALRRRVADMQQLLAHHRAEADRLAGEIRSLGYGQ